MTEAQAMARVDEAYRAYDAERRRPTGADPDRLAELERAFKQAQDEARELVVGNEFGEIIGEFALRISRRLGYEPELNGHSAYD